MKARVKATGEIINSGDERFHSECFGETKTSKGILIQPSLFGV